MVRNDLFFQEFHIHYLYISGMEKELVLDLIRIAHVVYRFQMNQSKDNIV